MMRQGLNDSQFALWRTVFALAHADHVVSDEEVRYLSEILEDVPFSPAQQDMLSADITTARDIEAMFAGITDMRDQALFFKFAGRLVHIDGDYSPEEQAVMLKLKRLHVQVADVAICAFRDVFAGNRAAD